MRLEHNDPVLNCQAPNPSNFLGHLTNQETCYFCQLVIYETMLSFDTEDPVKMYFKTYLSYISALFLYLTGALILSRKELRNTRPYPMIAVSLLIFGSLLQLNYTELKPLESQLLSLQNYKLFSELRSFLKLVGINTPGPVSIFQDIVEM